MTYSLAVVLCTFNPRPDLLRWALRSVRHQRQPAGKFEIVVIDNNSNPPVTVETVKELCDGIPFRVLREDRQGLIHARIRAIRATTSNLIVFVDDDNHLEPDYLETAVDIAGNHPELGCFGGKALPVFECKVPRWKERLLPYLGIRDYGALPITSKADEWGHWEPIGAGMVCRREVAEKFVEIAGRERQAIRLGRSGGELMSGEDSLIAHAAYRCGYACSYQPRLVLRHWMKAGRMSFGTLARTMAGHGRSAAILQAVRGQEVTRRGIAGSARHLAASLYWNVRNGGIGTGTLKWCWDVGYASQTRRMEM